MKNPDITIGITAFNAEETIAAAIESALAQSWKDIEIIVVDDASQDNTAGIVQKFQRENDCLRLLRNPVNGGVAAARNQIIREARGEFIAFFDDDDTSAQDRLRKQYERLIACEKKLKKEAMVICHSARNQHYPDGSFRYEPTIGMMEEGSLPHGSVVAEHILFNSPIPGGNGSIATCSQMARTQVYRALGGFDESFRRCEDTEFCLRLAITGGYFAGIAAPLVMQTMTLGSDKKMEEEHFYTLRLFEKHKALLEEKKRYHFDWEWIDAKFDFLSGRKEKFARRIFRLAIRHPFLTAQRIYFAFPGLGYNIAFSKYMLARPHE